MELIKSVLNNANPDIVIFLLTSLIAFLSWLTKGLIEKPIDESKITFNKYIEKRIEILSEIKTRLNFIAYFPKQEESKKFKEQLQELILKDGRACYLNKIDFDAVLKISITPETDEKLLLATIKTINEDLSSQISKVQDEILFYKKFSNFNPLKRFIGITLLVLQYILSLIIILAISFIVIYGLIAFIWYLKILTILIAITALYFINNWLKNNK